VAGRQAILEVHLKGKPLEGEVDAERLAKRTPGFTGADLANVVNEAAILAARRGARRISPKDLEAAVERVIAGPEKKTRVIPEAERRRVAYHEVGHALVGHVLPNGDPVHKISVVSRGRALGWTLAVPEEDRLLHTRPQLEDRLAMLLGGRAAEELVLGDVSTGAADDIERATKLARAMVTRYGMSDVLGPQMLAPSDGEVFLGRDGGPTPREHSEEVAARVDTEVTALLEAAAQRADAVLRAHRDSLERVAQALLERETLHDTDLAELLPPVGAPG
jgi:cell division protease FtsH